MAQDPKAIIERAVGLTIKLEEQLQELMQNPLVQTFLEAQKKVNEEAADTWKRVEALMIDNDIKKVDGDWGSLTITERMDFVIDEEQLAPRFKKTVADTSKIRTIYQLDRKPIAGATPTIKKYLTKRLKIGG